MEINGVAHVFLTVSDLSRSRTFYARLLPFLGMQPVMDSPESFIASGAEQGWACARARRSFAARRSTSTASGFITSACAPARARTSIQPMSSCWR
jgi:catechol 2,3-dioxygenase-like lactoylglutathione lyase family enzyme